MDREKRQSRSLQTDLNIREEQDGGDMVIEGYFALFNNQTELWPGAFEEIAPGAFSGSLSNDIRALINHDTRLVLGRNKNGTLELKEDSRGLWGRIKINSNDTDAVNLYERVKRGDIDQCSFGFNIISEETDLRDDGTIKWRLKEIDLHEISCVTFPAYDDTSIQARQRDAEQLRRSRREQVKNSLKERLSKWH